MTMRSDPIRATFSADAPQAEVLTALALVTGSRAGLSVEQLDDLVMALELLVRRRPGHSRNVIFAAGERGLEVSVSDVDNAWLHRRRPMLAVLVSDVAEDPHGVRLRVDA
jgi:hypothetical protein